MNDPAGRTIQQRLVDTIRAAGRRGCSLYELVDAVGGQRAGTVQTNITHAARMPGVDLVSVTVRDWSTGTVRHRYFLRETCPLRIVLPRRRRPA